MVSWIAPAHSASRVKAAGKRIRDGVETPEDLEVMENWRASHAYVLNIFQTNLRSRARQETITVAQRLKRRNTIFDKLKREPTMQLNTMHDIAGCRLIFQNQEELNAFRASLHQARFKHELRYREEDRYNYILQPKRSGYRGIHDVFKYSVLSQAGSQWNGLHVEIQYRTVYQHAWSTAVEAADLVTSSRIKFSNAEQRNERFFQVCSEIIARAFEGQTSCLRELTHSELLAELTALEESTALMVLLRNLKQSNNATVFKDNTILIFHTSGSSKDKPLEVETFDNTKEALGRYAVLEKEIGGTADIVLVRAKEAADVRDAFRNYFSDTHDFVAYIDEGRAKLSALPDMGRLSDDMFVSGVPETV